jgi:hypothetical protein
MIGEIWLGRRRANAIDTKMMVVGENTTTMSGVMGEN